MHRTQFSKQQPNWVTKFAVVISILGTLVLVGCGSSASLPPDDGGGGPKFNESKPATVQVRVGDSPADRVVALTLNFTSITVTNSSGKKYSVLSGPSSLEVSHLAATNQPMGMLQLATGNYKQLDIVLSGAAVTYLDPVTNMPVQKTFASVPPVTRRFSTPIKISSGGNLLNLDVDVAKTVNLDLVKNTVSLNTPVFNVTTSAVGSDGQQTPTNGAVENVTGVVTSVSGSNFTMTVGQAGSSLTFQTDNSTEFVNTSLASLNGTLVAVQGSSNADGTLLASEVENIGAGSGVAVEGVVTGYTKGGYLSMVAQDGAGSGMTDDMLGSNVSMALGGGTVYKIAHNDLDLANLPFVFNESWIVPGQRVEVESHNPVQADPEGQAAGFMGASVVELQPQSVSGTVSNYVANGDGTATLDLALPADGSSYLSGAYPGTIDVQVFLRAQTDMTGLSGDLTGKSVKVRGFLFFYDPSAFGMHQGRNLKSYIGGGGGSPSLPYFAIVAGRVSQ
jgi:hypothetical protein